MRVRDGYNPLAFVVVMAFILGMGINEFKRDRENLAKAQAEYAAKAQVLKDDFSAWASKIEGGVCGTPLAMDLFALQREIEEKYDVEL